MNDPPRDERVIFHAALASASEGDREALLQRACGEDDDLRSRIEALLVAHAREDLMEVPAVEREAKLVSIEPIAEREGSMIGRYKLLQQIGEGGFGVVHMAEQQAPIQRRVALKIIKLGMDTKQVIARFEAERQTLALMDHPNIARILDAGRTDTGRPYFVMDLVRGVPVTQYCDDYSLTTDDRLRVFMQICRAVHHAHQKGIIHRDIKPNNILVSHNGDQAVPMVIDFGIAKATQGRLTDKTLFTHFGQFIGTPAYMSPEQAQMSALDVDTRSDIYSLGVLLYELMTGATPFDPTRIKATGYEAICRQIREEEPMAPSKRLSSFEAEELTSVASARQAAPGSLSAIIRGDLDWIVMKAMEKDRSRRYSSADALAKDVERYLNRQPVLAAPPSSLYLAQKFARRHRRLLTTIGIIATTLLVATFISSWLAITKSRLSVNLADEMVAKNSAIEDVRRANLALADQLKVTQAARAEAEMHAYVSDMYLAYQAYEESNLSLALRILEEYRVSHENSFEWKCLKWRCDTGDSLATIRDHEDEVLQIAVSKQGVIASFARDQMIRLHDLNSNRQTDSWKHPCPVSCLEFTPGGEHLVIGDHEGRLYMWQARPRRLLTTIPAVEADELKGQQIIRDIVFCDEGEIIAIATAKGVELWNLKLEKKQNELPHGTMHLDFSARKNLLVRGGVGSGQALAVADAATGRELGLVSQSHTSYLCDVKFSFPEGKYLATSSWDTTIRLWDVEQIRHSGAQRYGRPLAIMRGHRSSAQRLDFSPQGDWLVSCSDDGTVRLWPGNPPLRMIESPMTTLRGHKQRVNDVAYSPDGSKIVSASSDQSIKVWPGTPTAGRNALEGHEDWVFDVAFSPDGKLMGSGAFDGEVRLWDSYTQELLFREKLHDHQVFSVVFSPDGEWMASCSAVWRINTREQITFDTPGAVVLTNVNSRESQRVKMRAEAGVRAIAFLPDGRLVVGDFQGWLWIWDMERRDIVGSVHVGQGRVDGLCCSPDGSLISVSQWLQGTTNARELHTFRTQGLERVSVIDEGYWGAWRIEYAPTTIGENLVASGVRFFDVVQGRKVDQWSGGGSGCVAFAPDGRTMATSGTGTIRLWNIGAQREVANIPAHHGLVMGLAFSPNGSMLASASEDSTIRIWRTSSD